MESEPLSIVSPLSPRNSTCGYCGPPGERSKTRSSFHAAECMPMQLSCRVYQEMIDRGWRRSGTYCYKPDLRRSCCPQYTIKLDSLDFKPSKSQRKLINRWNKFVLLGESTDEAMDDGAAGSSKPAPKKAKGRGEYIFSLTEDIHAPETNFLRDQRPAHRFEVTLEPPSNTPEKFALYNSYQANIHNDHDKDPQGFARFLVKSPLLPRPIDYPSGRPEHLPANYGSYHQLYRLDGKLIAMGVIDILPNCVSSVYFMYEKEWEKFSFGKLSALREVSLAKEIHEAGVPGMQYLYLGFYVHSCQKMRYKGEYSPSYLADPEDYIWHPLEKCRPLLDKNHYVSFSHPEHSLSQPASSAGPTPSFPPEILEGVKHVVGIDGRGIEVAPISRADEWKRAEARKNILITLNAFGTKLATQVIFYLAYDLE